jgi:CelD/BcsL family acetyltransferase involved in cellulose biosynthesis
MSTSSSGVSQMIRVQERSAIEGVDGLAERPLEVRLCTSWSELEAHVGDWERLLANTPSASIFGTPEWLGAWWRAFGPADLRALLFFDGTAGLVGLAALYPDVIEGPLGLRLNRLRLVGDGSNDSDNLDFLVRPGYEPSCARTLLGWLGHRSGWDICELNTLPSDSPTATGLVRELKQRGWTHALHTQPRLVVALPGTWEAYRNQLSSKERGKLGYYARRLERKHRLRIRKCSDPARLSQDLDCLFRLHQKRWTARGEAGSFSSAARRQFYEEVARLFLARSWLEFWVLELDGRAAAAQFAFRYLDTAYSLQEGFDPEDAQDSVGYVLRGHVLQQLIAGGIRRYDFLAGMDPVKLRWNPERRSYLNIHLARPLGRGSLYLWAVRSGHSAKEWMRTRLPRSLFAAARSAYRWAARRRDPSLTAATAFLR